jgi:hypothetical protein
VRTDELPPNHRVTAAVAVSRLTELAAGLAGALRVLCSHGLATGPWQSANGTAAAIEPTARALAAHLDSVLAARDRSEARPCLLRSGQLVVVADVPPGEPAAVWFPLPALSLDACLSLLDDLAVALDAYHAHVEDDRLMLGYQAHRATERARAAVPEEYRQYIPEPPESPPGQELPRLLVPQEYDSRRVPAGVWWVNYWDPTQLHTLGEERVRAAPWARIRHATRGGLLLAATEEPSDPGVPDHVARLRRLVTELRLRAAQERFRR